MHIILCVCSFLSLSILQDHMFDILNILYFEHLFFFFFPFFFLLQVERGKHLLLVGMQLLWVIFVLNHSFYLKI